MNSSPFYFINKNTKYSPDHNNYFRQFDNTFYHFKSALFADLLNICTVYHVDCVDLMDIFPSNCDVEGRIKMNILESGLESATKQIYILPPQDYTLFDRLKSFCDYSNNNLDLYSGGNLFHFPVGSGIKILQLFNKDKSRNDWEIIGVCIDNGSVQNADKLTNFIESTITMRTSHGISIERKKSKTQKIKYFYGDYAFTGWRGK